MTTERWRQIETIFEEVSGSPPDQRVNLLKQACGDDRELQSEVESLLAQDAEDDNFLQARVEGAADHLAREQTSAMIGSRVGAWRITGLIGHGGMGAVYRAVRDDDQYEKEVALKLVRRGIASEADVRRFRRERQILARLEHPNIARLIDGGTTGEGLPYLVMEYVKGQPITQYSRERSLSIDARLRLFRSVCGAVQYAHQNLIVHRDLKPANILVTEEGAVKLLDFGIAKLIDPSGEGAETVTSGWLMTPDYASPEQIKGEGINAVSDVYSLGAILYELLTDSRPHQTRSRSAAEIERMICQEETQPPSTAAGLRHLRGDLDNIVLMAMRKEPSRRYGSVEQLSEDLRRYLNGLPVTARKDTLGYRAGKFLRRNRWSVGIAAASAVALMITTAVAVLQARRAQAQFNAVRDLATTMLIEVNDKVRMLPGSVDARVVMVRKGLEYLDRIGREAGQDPAILWDLARGYEKIATLQASPDPAEPNLGDVKNGLQSYRRALEYAQAVERARGRDQESLLLLCRIHVGIGGRTTDNAEARKHLNESLRLNALLAPETGRILDAKGPKTGPYLKDLALGGLGFLELSSDPQAALGYFNQTWDQFRLPMSVYALDLMGDIERAAAAAGEYERFQRELQFSYPAEDIRKRVMRIATARSIAQGCEILGSPFRMNLGNTVQAMAACRRSLEMLDLVVGQDSSDMGSQVARLLATNILGAVQSTFDPEAAVKTYTQVLSSKLYPGRGLAAQDIKGAAWQISYPLRSLGRYEEALHAALRAVKDSPDANSHAAAAAAYLDLGKREAAAEQYRLAVTAAEKRVAALPRNMKARGELGRTLQQLGAYHEKTGDGQTAGQWYLKAHDVWSKWTQAGGVSNPFVIRSERETAEAVARCGRKKRDSFLRPSRLGD